MVHFIIIIIIVKIKFYYYFLPVIASEACHFIFIIYYLLAQLNKQQTDICAMFLWFRPESVNTNVTQM